MQLTEYEQMQPHVLVDGLVFLTPNTHCAWRVDTLYTKEPDTIAWITTMGEGDVLYDVGANMGQYSMLAAKRGVRVHAFEPDSQNFALLCRNIAVNKLGHLITPWPIALSDTEGLDIFYVTQLMAGGSCNTFGEQVDFHLKPKEFSFAQGCYGTKLDKIGQHHEYPTHIKIDVDGLEHKVLAGAQFTLPTVKSVLVETNTKLAEHTSIEAAMRQYGLHPDHETAEVARRKEGPFEGIGNVIYYRREA